MYCFSASTTSTAPNKHLPVMVMTLSSEKNKNYCQKTGLRQACSKTTQNVLTTTTYNKKERKGITSPATRCADPRGTLPRAVHTTGGTHQILHYYFATTPAGQGALYEFISVPTDKFAFCGTKRTSPIGLSIGSLCRRHFIHSFLSEPCLIIGALSVATLRAHPSLVFLISCITHIIIIYAHAVGISVHKSPTSQASRTTRPPSS